MKDFESLAHVRWECKYHVIFIPKYRLHEQTGLPVRITPEPLTAVAQGLLICMEHFEQWRRWLQSSEEDV